MFDDFKKAYSLPLSKSFQIINPKYVYLKLTPATSIRNYNSGIIAKTIALTFRNNVIDLFNSVRKFIRKEEEKVFYKAPSKISYYVLLEKENVQFFIIVPEVHLGLIKEKVGEVWKGITISVVEDIPILKDALYYQLNYKKEDALSLATDKRSNTLLESQLNSLDFLEEGDRLSITYNFIPCNQASWKTRYKETIDKVNSRQPVEKEKLSDIYIIKKAFSLIWEVLDMCFEVAGELLGAKKKNRNQSYLEVAIGLSKTELSKATLKKSDKTIVDTQIVCGSESSDSYRKNYNLIGLTQSFSSIGEDNSIVGKELKGYTHDLLKYKFDKVGVNKMSSDEIQNLISLPGRDLLNEHRRIEKIDVLETHVPDELKNGYIRIGDNIVRGNKVTAYMSQDRNLANLGLMVLGPQGSGKSEYFKNYAYDVIQKNEGLIVIDYIKDCDLSKIIKSITPKHKLIEINLGESSDLQGFGYNEIKVSESKDIFERLELSNMQTQQDMALIDAISKGNDLSSRMRRFLSAACNIVHIHSNTSLRDVINVLVDFKIRKEYINSIPGELTSYLEDDIRSLNELDEYSKATKDGPEIEVIGTKESKIEHILDRVNLLKEDFKLKYMFNKSVEDNIDFVQAMEQGKVILIQIPEHKYPLKYIKNVLATYFISKVWLSAQLRGEMHSKPRRNHVIIDEVFQAPTSENILVNILPQARKFQLKFVFSAHYLSQVETIREALKASGSSYMLLQGTDKKNYRELEEELLPFELEDLLNLKRYNSLNLIKTSKGYSSFVTTLPKPIK